MPTEPTLDDDVLLLPIQGLGRRMGSRPVSCGIATAAGLFRLPRLTEELEIGWPMFPLLIESQAGIRRSDLQQWMEARGVDTRMVWTGNAARQPAFRNRPHRVPDGGVPNADRIMERGPVLPNNHATDDDDCSSSGECLEAFVGERGLG